MKEFKFWAIPYTMKQFLTILIPVWIIYIPVIFYIDQVFEYFIYFLFGTWALALIFLFFFLKRVKISFSPSNEISIWFNGKKKYSGNSGSLGYVRGADIRDKKSSASLVLAFSDKTFTFLIGEKQNSFSSKAGVQIDLLRYMVAVFNLEKEHYKEGFMTNIYTYSNPAYKGRSDVSGYNRNERS